MILGSPTRRPAWQRGAARFAPIGLVAPVFALAALALASSPAGARDVYTYKIEHPTLGDIGSYTDTVTRTPDGHEIDTRLRVAVRVLGIVLHREEADRTEVWRGGRLVAFHSVTTTNGERIAVDGAADGDGFVITSPHGREVVPADVRPSNPWSAIANNATSFMMSTKSGKLFQVHNASVEAATIQIRGVDVPVQHYVFMTDKRQDVWKDARGVPVEFRTVEPVGPIDFTLTDETVAADSPTPAPAPDKALAATPR
jgi:hypothetical protein